MASDNIVCVNEDYINVTFFSHKRGIFSVDFNSTRLGDFNLDEDDPEINHARHMTCCKKTNNVNYFKKS